MPPKKDQHLIPQVHLRQFTTVDLPGRPLGRPITPFIWLVPKDLSAPPSPRSPRNAFVATRPYNLSSDNPDIPFLEEGLGRVESLYGPLVQRLAAGVEPNLQDWTVIAFFVGTLRVRTLSDIDHWQSIFSDLEGIHRHIEREVTGGDDASKRIFSPEISKHLLPGRAETYAKVVGPGGWLLRNESDLDFISADIPVAHHFLHPDELLRLGFPIQWFTDQVTPATRAFVSICPLSPRLSFISSPLLEPPANSFYRSVASAASVIGVNELVRVSARKVLIARTPKPYAAIQSALVRLDSIAAAATPAYPFHLKVYTQNNRTELGAIQFSHTDGPNPLQSQIRFRTDQLQRLRTLAASERIDEVLAYESGHEIGGMRGAMLTTVALGTDADTVIEQDLVRWPNLIRA